MKKILPYILTAFISTGLSVGLVFLLNAPQGNKTGYVQLAKVYSDFELSKKLNAQFKQTATSRKNYLDSLEFTVKTLYTKAGSNQNDQLLMGELESAQRHYMYQKEQVDASVGALEEQYNEQIWKQLNEYITQYGKEKGYSYIFGAEGSGSIMYGSPAEDLTEEVLLYVNQKYQGG